MYTYLLKEKNSFFLNFESCKLGLFFFRRMTKIRSSTFGETLFSYENIKTIPLLTQPSNAWSGLVILYTVSVCVKKIP
jgi:hypothetical protein